MKLLASALWLLAATVLPMAAPGVVLAQTSSPAGQAGGVGALLGASENDVRAALGEPAVARREDGGAMWTYRLPACALFVFFRASGREGLRVVGATSGPRRRGDAAPSAEVCLAAAVK
jgi:hypothetical protein